MTELIEVNVANLSGEALDWAVAKVEGVAYNPNYLSCGGYRDGSQAWSNWSISNFRPSADWIQGGPLFDKYQGSAHHEQHLPLATSYSAGIAGSGFWCYGPNALVAFCRSLVKTKLGDTVQVPKELI